jgi:hypothetical protein
MITRSKTKIEKSTIDFHGNSEIKIEKTDKFEKTDKIEKTDKFEVNIDFDGASEAWRANKISIGNGSYKYLCQKITKNNNNCKRKCLLGENYCKIHK